MSSPATLPFNLDNTLGALLIGGLFATAFWGVTSAQTYIYYQRYPNDRLSLKLIVALIWALDTFDACLTSHALYYYLVTNYVNPIAITTPVWSILVHVAVTSITDSIIRSMFAWRVWRLSNRNVILTSIVVAIMLCDLVVGITITVKAFRLESYAQVDTLTTLFYINFGAGTSGDIFVAVVLCYYLFSSRTGRYLRMDTLLNTLITYVITTGLFTSAIATLGTVTYAAMPTNFIYLGFYFNLAKTYINSYLASLNARQQLRQSNDRPTSIHLAGLSDDPYTTSFGLEGSVSSPTDKITHRDLEVHVQTTVDHKSDQGLARY